MEFDVRTYLECHQLRYARIRSTTDSMVIRVRNFAVYFESTSGNEMSQESVAIWISTE